MHKQSGRPGVLLLSFFLTALGYGLLYLFFLLPSITIFFFFFMWTRCSVKVARSQITSAFYSERSTKMNCDCPELSDGSRPVPKPRGTPTATAGSLSSGPVSPVVAAARVRTIGARVSPSGDVAVRSEAPACGMMRHLSSRVIPTTARKT